MLYIILYVHPHPWSYKLSNICDVNSTHAKKHKPVHTTVLGVWLKSFADTKMIRSVQLLSVKGKSLVWWILSMASELHHHFNIMACETFRLWNIINYYVHHQSRPFLCRLLEQYRSEEPADIQHVMKRNPAIHPFHSWYKLIEKSLVINEKIKLKCHALLGPLELIKIRSAGVDFITWINNYNHIQRLN